MTLVVLFLSALFSAVISGLVGMAGGITLLAILTFFFPLNVLIPIHGAVQFTSNISRTMMLRSHVRLDIMKYFLLGSPFAALFAYLFLRHLGNWDHALYLVVFLLFYVAFKPKKLPDIAMPIWCFALLGFAATFLSPLIGATGPLLAPFFARADLKKEEIVATKASCQLLVHLYKFPIFLGLAFPYQDYGVEILLMLAGVVFGTRLGVSLLKKVSTEHFRLLLRAALAITGLRLLWKLAYSV